jgi:hypothetical protein
MTRTLLFALLVVLAVSACDPSMCTLEARASLAVTVQDSAGAPITDATVTAALEGEVPRVCEPAGEDGSYLCDYFEIAGVFVVTAAKTGYGTDERTVTVTDGECHVQAESVTFALVPDANACCCAFIREGDIDIISEEPTATEQECLVRDTGSCIDPTGRYTPHPCCPDATGDRCE